MRTLSAALRCFSSSSTYQQEYNIVLNLHPPIATLINTSPTGLQDASTLITVTENNTAPTVLIKLRSIIQAHLRRHIETHRPCLPEFPF